MEARETVDMAHVAGPVVHIFEGGQRLHTHTCTSNNMAVILHHQWLTKLNRSGSCIIDLIHNWLLMEKPSLARGTNKD